jgi:pimeloyl-ACP methyl ester carboxylesterase
MMACTPTTGAPLRAVDSVKHALPAVTRHTLADAGHMPWLEVPSQFGDLLLDYLRRVGMP